MRLKRYNHHLPQPSPLNFVNLFVIFVAAAIQAGFSSCHVFSYQFLISNGSSQFFRLSVRDNFFLRVMIRYITANLKNDKHATGSTEPFIFRCDKALV